MKLILVALFAPLLIWPAAVSGQPRPSSVSDKQLANAAKLIVKLEGFDVFTKSNPGPREYKSRLQEFLSAIYKSASRLPESHLRTDITTAVHLYELASLDQDETDLGEGQCLNEKPGAYQRLCEANSGSRNQLLLAKARLHVNWARAAISPAQDAQTNQGIEIELERVTDRALAERALAALKRLQGEVMVHSSLADFEEAGTLGRVPYETFKNNLRTTTAEVERILSWLPQNLLKFEISNALHSYQDGGLWWSRIYQSRVVDVSELSSEAPNRPSLTAFQTTVPYTVAINWRQAGQYLERAEDLITRSSGSRTSAVRFER